VAVTVEDETELVMAAPLPKEGMLILLSDAGGAVQVMGWTVAELTVACEAPLPVTVRSQLPA
jgi:hypothetical protein